MNRICVVWDPVCPATFVNSTTGEVINLCPIVPVIVTGDLVASKVGSFDSATGTGSFTINLSNGSNVPITNIVITDPIVDGIASINTITPSGSVILAPGSSVAPVLAPGTLTFNIASLAPGASGAITFTFTGDGTTAIFTNMAFINYLLGGQPRSQSVSITVEGAAITVVNDVDAEDGTAAISVTNNGAVSAYGVAVRAIITVVPVGGVVLTPPAGFTLSETSPGVFTLNGTITSPILPGNTFDIIIGVVCANPPIANTQVSIPQSTAQGSNTNQAVGTLDTDTFTCID